MQEYYQLHNNEILSFNRANDKNIFKFVKSTAPHDKNIVKFVKITAPHDKNIVKFVKSTTPHDPVVCALLP
jgi:hypothetical protein